MLVLAGEIVFITRGGLYHVYYFGVMCRGIVVDTGGGLFVVSLGSVPKSDTLFGTLPTER